LKRLFERGEVGQVSADALEKIANILAVLDRASRPEDMDLPGFRLHPSKGVRRDYWSVAVRANWRITWRFESIDVADVDLIDYH
jgi:proteic killer suppression protein